MTNTPVESDGSSQVLGDVLPWTFQGISEWAAIWIAMAPHRRKQHRLLIEKSKIRAANRARNRRTRALHRVQRQRAS